VTNDLYPEANQQILITSHQDSNLYRAFCRHPDFTPYPDNPPRSEIKEILPPTASGNRQRFEIQAEPGRTLVCGSHDHPQGEKQLVQWADAFDY